MAVSLRKALYDAVDDCTAETNVGVAFSGGVDSALLAKICSDLGKQVVLITVGFPGSHDIDFSKRIALLLGLTQKITEIDDADFRKKLGHIQKAINCTNTSHIENCIAYYYIALAAKEERLKTVLSANGCDELFCGYNGFRLVFHKGQEALSRLMEEKIANEYQLVEEINTVTRKFGVTVKQPFLDSKFVAFAKTIPFEFKITGSNDMQRKHILRQVALQVGVPAVSAMKPKKALQYGSLIHKNFQRAKSTK